MVNGMSRSAGYDEIKIGKKTRKEVRTVASFLKSYKFYIFFIFQTFQSSGRLKYLI